jgi:hypothetical protein
MKVSELSPCFPLTGTPPLIEWLQEACCLQCTILNSGLGHAEKWTWLASLTRGVHLAAETSEAGPSLPRSIKTKNFVYALGRV